MDKEYKCLRCQKIFRYNYLLERHINKKNICTPSSSDSYKFNKYNFDELKELLRNNIDNQEQLSNIIDNIEKYVKKEYVVQSNNDNKSCKACNKEFKTKQNYEKHLKTDKCKIKTSQYNSTITLSNNVDTNINNNSNNIVNSNNNIMLNNNFVVYPIGCETINHIDIEKIKKIKSYKDYIPYVARCLQRDEKNLNFTKQNMNKPYITILNSDMVLEDVPENEFYGNYLINTERKTVELIYVNKANLTKEEMIDIFRNLLADQKLCKLSEKENNKKLSLLKAITHRTLRSKNVYNKLSKIEQDTLKGYNKLLIDKLKKLKKDQYLILNESRIDPKKRNKKLIEGTDLEKNLYNIILKAEELNKISEEKMIKETYNISNDTELDELDLESLL